jgi:hypothetical protein
MNVPKPKKMRRSEYGRKTIDFLSIAYRDYLAARVLLNADLLVQGVVLASTAVEKYLKAILAFRGNESRGHLKAAHWRAALDFDARLSKVLNPEFLQLLQKCYKLRYLDDIEVNFNLVIASREFLAELDYAALMLQESFRIQHGEKPHLTQYHDDKRDRDPRLVMNNYLFAHQDKQRFILEEPQVVYELRMSGPNDLMEVTYLARPVPSDGKFMRSGFTPIPGTPMQFQMAFKPVPPETEA